MPGTLFVVATPIGNLEDITMRALRVLREVPIIAAEDTRRTAQLLARHAITTPTTSLHEHNEGRKSPAILARLESGDNVALVSDAGSPTVSDPGSHLIRQALAAGVRVEPIPGPSAVLAALTVSGMPTESFSFLGFPPTRSKDRKEWLDRLRRIGGTAVFFEAPHRIRRTLTDLHEAAGNVTIAVCRELTKIHEELVKGPILDVLGCLGIPRGEFTVVVDVGQTTESHTASYTAGIPEEPQSKRQALADFARSQGLSVNALYRAIADAKKSVN
jgi:16S rRNA (cytidine1402-2'-O)-methyltransferase